MDAFNAPPADLQCADMRDDRCAKFAASSGSANIGLAGLDQERRMLLVASEKAA
jgi:hypothetical protein